MNVGRLRLVVGCTALALVGCRNLNPGCRDALKCKGDRIGLDALKCKGDRIGLDGKCTDGARPTPPPSTSAPSSSDPNRLCGSLESVLANLAKVSADSYAPLPSLEMVNVGDLDDDGRAEYAGTVVTRVYSESWVLTGSEKDCFVDRTEGSLGGKVTKPLSSMTNGWRDLEVVTVLNGTMGISRICRVTYTATFDGKRYKLSKVLSIDVDENAEITPSICRTQAEELMADP